MKLLFPTSRLGLGGAETHIIGLAKALSDLGHTVTIVSAGGKLVSTLPPSVQHITLPLDKKDPLSLFRSLRGLYHLLQTEHFDVVHAHARIPAVLCHLLRRRQAFRLVTTAHLDFPRKAFGLFSRWGERTLAVSQDIKDHLIRTYHLSPDTIAVTVNGIDTEHFSPPPLSPAGDRLLHVSRLDRDRSQTAFLLLRIATVLQRQFPTFQLTILGEGEDLPALRAEAQTYDPQGHFLTIGGGVADPAPYLREATLFVGVSRAALEAMACGLPVILSGNQGYGGILTPETMAEAAATNLCCRGRPLPTETSLLTDLTALLSDHARATALGRFGRETVLRDYPFSRTASDCLALYAALPPLPTQVRNGILLCGYFGYGNTGDEAILTVQIADLRQEESSRPITVLSAAPRQTARTHGVKAIGRFALPAILRELNRCQTLLFGGGGLLQDDTSFRSLLYYTTLLHVAARMKKTIRIQANGIGPLHRTVSRRLVASALRHGVIQVRDRTSLALLRSLGLSRKLTVVSDSATALLPADNERISHLLRRYGLQAGQFAVIVPKGNARIPITLPSDITPVWIPFFPAEDRQACLRGMEDYPDSVLIEGLSPAEIRGLIGVSAWVLGMRLHALIFAETAGVPYHALGNNPKLMAFVRDRALPIPHPPLGK